MPEDFASKEQTFLVLNPSKKTPKCISVLPTESVTEHTPKGSVTEEETIVQINPAELYVVAESEDSANPLPVLLRIELRKPEGPQSQKMFSDFFRDQFYVFLTGNKSTLVENTEITNHEFAEYVYQHEYNKTKEKVSNFLRNVGFEITEECIKSLSFVQGG